MSETELIPHRVGNVTVHQRRPDGYFNATAMCQAVGKLFAEYRRAKPTREFLTELSSVTGISHNGLIKVLQGGPPDLQGTWVHPDVAIHLAQWCSPKFAVAVAGWVREWLGRMSSYRIWEEFYPGWESLHPQVSDLPREIEFQFSDAQLLLFKLD